MPDMLLVEQHAEAAVAIAGAVVGEDAADREAEAGVVGAGHVEEAYGRGMLLVGQDGGEGDPGVVVDGDVEVLVSCAACLASAVTMDAMAGFDDTGQTLDIEVDQVARTFVLVADDRWRRIERTQPVHTRTMKDAAHGRAAELDLAGDPPAVPAQPAKSKNLFYESGGGLAMAEARPRAAVSKRFGSTLLVAADPFGRRLRADIEAGCSQLQRQALVQDSSSELPSTVKRQSGILMAVHSIS